MLIYKYIYAFTGAAVPPRIAENGRHSNGGCRASQQFVQVNKMIDLIMMVCEITGTLAAILIGVTLFGIAIEKVRV